MNTASQQKLTASFLLCFNVHATSWRRMDVLTPIKLQFLDVSQSNQRTKIWSLWSRRWVETNLYILIWYFSSASIFDICTSKEYVVINDERQWNKRSSLPSGNDCYDDEPFTSEAWVRFETMQNQSMRVAENCPRTVETSSEGDAHFCGAIYRGWVRGNHPTMDEGMLDQKF